jgi:hypothetical protein
MEINKKKGVKKLGNLCVPNEDVGNEEVEKSIPNITNDNYCYSWISFAEQRTFPAKNIPE